MSNKLQGKVAAVTGSNSGIRLATARRFVTEGASEARRGGIAIAPPDPAPRAEGDAHLTRSGRRIASRRLEWRPGSILG
jgi:NAD(P)-dependent dehydrogenase (short-subunit alcohol dehydrogenase family)